MGKIPPNAVSKAPSQGYVRLTPAPLRKTVLIRLTSDLRDCRIMQGLLWLYAHTSKRSSKHSNSLSVIAGVAFERKASALWLNHIRMGFMKQRQSNASMNCLNATNQAGVPHPLRNQHKGKPFIFNAALKVKTENLLGIKR